MSITLTMDTSISPTTACVYEHRIIHVDGSTELIYVGACLLNDLLRAPDARRNSKWREITSFYPLLSVRAVTLYDTIVKAKQNVESYIYQTGSTAICNQPGYQTDQAQKIMCIESGEVFDKAATACRQYGIAASAMSNHLNNQPGYQTARNLTFRRV